tara:strand:- start:291 stop:1022 length:732 start_codon:yes stop_codon:yes gene_type:complete
MKKNKIDIFRKKFKNKNTVGGWLQLGDPNSAKIISKSKNLDWICLDMEHGLINLSSISKIIDAVEFSNKIILTRISFSDVNNIPKILDLGVDGIIIANIKTENDILKIYRLSNYPPLGERGLGFSKYNNFNLNKKDLKIKPIIIPMIENIYAYKNLEKIMNYKNLIDGLFIGPVDLSLSMNDMLKFSIKHKKAINIIKQKCKKNNIPIGLHIIKGTKKDIIKTFRGGFGFVAYLTDTVILQGY